MSFFAFEHKTGSHWHMYSHYTVIDINSYRARINAEKLKLFIGAIKVNNGCEWADEHAEKCAILRTRSILSRSILMLMWLLR
ncbi:hypothetical protein vBSsoS008_005 [Shigella phage vB_SsoS_008]|nr:hypothetical protein vBSsoS008_005 [Shigella phage vB_SsoS_008]